MLRQHLPVVSLVCFGIFASVLTFTTLRSFESEKAKAAFQRVAQERLDSLQSDLDGTVSKVISLGAFCEAGYPITYSSFDTFSAPLFYDHNPGILTLDWVPRVTLSQRAAFERSARTSGLSGYEIRDSLEPGKMVRSGDRPFYFPVLYLQHQGGTHLASGFDLYANPARREALTRAASTGELTATRRITLIQNLSDQRGIVLLRPVYRHTDPSFDKKELLGFAVGVVRVNDMIEQHGANSGIDLAVSDMSASPAERELYPSAGKRPQHVSPFTQNRTISVGGRIWQVVASPMPGAFPVTKTYSYAGSAFCLLFTVMVAALLVDTRGRRRQVERVVEERTSDLNVANHSLAEVHRGLEESEARYRRLVEASPSAIVVERGGKIVLVNRVAVEMFGIDATWELEDHKMADFVVPERRESANQLLLELYAKDTQISARETRVLRRDGSIVEVEFVASSFFQDGLRSIQIVLRDITQRKLGQAENARLIRAIEQVEESIVIADIDANIVYVNPAFERISGYSREEVIGKNPRVLNSGRQSKQFYASLWESLISGESWSGRIVNRCKNGRLFTEEATISPVIDRSGNVINYVAVKRDVTLETELQEQLHQSQKMDAIGRLAGGVAHDFNNMLMVIVSYADLLDSCLPENDPLRKHTWQILQAAQRSAALTRQLLAFSRKQVLAPQVLDCNVIITETSSMVRRLISENIELKCNLAPDLWPVKADADQIVQVILNLCVNSRDAMPNGGALVLTTSNYHFEEGFVEFSVSDTGMGIPLELQEKLFEPFFTTKGQGKGTGLGLATVYGIVQQSGGNIRVKSSPGRGSTFTIYLPRCLEPAPVPEPPIKKPLFVGRSLVLVVEDEDALREAIAQHLGNHGYQVLTAADGIEALDTISRNPDITIMISDLIMPRMGGRELARLATKTVPNLNIVFMSGYADQGSSDEAWPDCPTVFLQKPFNMSVLLTRIAELKHHPGITTIQ
jgi:PAS domain S-box-containing protein